MSFQLDLEDIPQLKKGDVVEFKKALSFGTFKAKLFVVEDAHQCLFRVFVESGDDNKDTQGKVVKILPTLLRILAWQILAEPFLCESLAEIVIAPSNPQLSLFEFAGGF